MAIPARAKKLFLTVQRQVIGDTMPPRDIGEVRWSDEYAELIGRGQ